MRRSPGESLWLTCTCLTPLALESNSQYYNNVNIQHTPLIQMIQGQVLRNTPCPYGHYQTYTNSLSFHHPHLNSKFHYATTKLGLRPTSSYTFEHLTHIPTNVPLVKSLPSKTASCIVLPSPKLTIIQFPVHLSLLLLSAKTHTFEFVLVQVEGLVLTSHHLFHNQQCVIPNNHLELACTHKLHSNNTRLQY